MKFTIKNLLLSLSIITLFHYAHAANPPVELEKKEGTKRDTQSFMGLEEKVALTYTAAVLKTIECSKTITIDTEKARNHITKLAAGEGYLPERAAEIVNDVILEAEGLLTGEVPVFTAKLITAMTESYQLAIADLADPEATFQADYSYYVTQENENKWDRGGVNLDAIITGIIIKGDGTIGFKAGVAAGLQADVDFKLYLSGLLSFELDGFNPVGPVTGTGRSITIKATPKYKTKIGFSAGGEAFLKVVVGVELPGNGRLPDMQSTLSI